MKDRIIGLDLLRVLAAWGIMMYHFFFIGPLQGFYSMDTFIEGAFLGEFGVDIFFILSGYSIFLSIKNRTRKDFILSRIKRIYPAFFLCATFTMLCGFMMPNISISDLLFRYICNFTFLQDILNVDPLSSLYWTLMVEVKFYILIFLFAWTNLWKKNYHYIISIWLVIAVCNTFLVHNSLLGKILITQYAGHFVMGMIIFSGDLGKNSKLYYLETVLSGILIWNNCFSHSSWLQSLYPIGMTEFRVFLLTVTIIMVVYTFANLKKIYLFGGYYQKLLCIWLLVVIYFI